MTDFPSPPGECKGSTLIAPNAHVLWWQDGLIKTFTETQTCDESYDELCSYNRKIVPKYTPDPSLGADVTAVVDVSDTDSTPPPSYTVRITTVSSSVYRDTSYDLDHQHYFNPLTA